jgi:solute:Na+ symporter, SSS family
MNTLDYAIVVVYIVALLALGFFRRVRKTSTPAEVIVGGRLLTLPGFVATLVSTWYGGILGIGEYSYNYGVSNWLVFGLPYYLAAFLFAMFLAKRARRSEVLSVPHRLAQVYDNKTATLAGFIIYFMTIPAAYILMLGVLAQQLFGWPLWLGVLVGAFFSIVYSYIGGFGSVVRTEGLQFVLMFLGFAVLLVVLVTSYGGLDFLTSHLPETHLTWHGGKSGWYIASWYFIALAALIDPAFYQRCCAARTENTARNGILISIACWAVFDFMTTSCGLYARALLPDLADPVASYHVLAVKVLPAGLLGLFALALLATVMSTVDSYAFLAATTLGNDILPRLGLITEAQVSRFTRLGIVASSLLSVLLALFFRSVVDIWHVFGSIGTPALLIPVFVAFVGLRRQTAAWAFRSILAGGAVSLLWFLTQYWVEGGDYLFGWQPIFPGLAASLILWFLSPKAEPVSLPLTGE